MEYIYIKKVDDIQIIADYKKWFEAKTLEELVEYYNSQVKCGITGVHRQALCLIGLQQEFGERLKKSPIYLLGYVLGLTGPIEIVNSDIRIVN